LKEKDPENEKGIVKLIEHFAYKKNYCMVFENLGMSLYEVLKKFNYRGFTMKQVQSFFKQILQSVGFLHEQKLTHTDLKAFFLKFLLKNLAGKYIIENKSTFRKTIRDRRSFFKSD